MRSRLIFLFTKIINLRFGDNTCMGHRTDCEEVDDTIIETFSSLSKCKLLKIQNSFNITEEGGGVGTVADYKCTWLWIK